MDPASKPTRFPAIDLDEPGLCGPDQKVLLDYHMPARLEEIEKLAIEVNKALSGHEDLAFAANLCLEELIANTIIHGLKGAADHSVHVCIRLSEEWLEILLKDDAPQFDPFGQAPSPRLDLTVDERPVGGLGVHMVRTLMDRTRASYDGTGNLIVLCKALRRQAS